MLNASLALVDGTAWSLSAADRLSEQFLERLGEALQLRPNRQRASGQSPYTRQIVLTSTKKPQALADSLPAALEAVRRNEPATCCVEPWNGDNETLAIQMMRLTTLMGAVAQQRGGALIHSALAIHPHPEGNTGVLLAGIGGTGKTTASNRLPAPWIPLCDDTVLVVRDAGGSCMAHPWPTWSRFFWGGNGGSWNTEQAVPLRGIFFLEQAAQDCAEPLGKAHAAAALTFSIKQVSKLMLKGLEEPLARELRLEWFESACSLTRLLPSYRLKLSLTGRFWLEIEHCLWQEAA
jgi:SynChlorMet cassette protein ScmC